MLKVWTGAGQEYRPVLNILLVDDQFLQSGGRAILDARADWTVIEASRDLEAVRHANTHDPHVVVLAADQPGLDAIEASALLTEWFPAVPVLITSDAFDEEVAGRALRAGARGFVLRESAGEDLVRAIEALVAGESYFSPTVAKWILEQYLRDRPCLPMSPRSQRRPSH